MDTGSTWRELAAQQLVRYEALFKLLDDIQGLDEIPAMSHQVAMQWKYFASVSSWRMVVFHERRFCVIDGFRGEAHVQKKTTLSRWDAYHRSLQRPCASHMRGNVIPGHPPPPEHLAGKRIAEVRVFPFKRADRWIALLSVAARNEPFSELDTRFIRIFGSHFADRISDILLRRQATEALIQKASHDALTGLLNRGAIIERLQACLELSNHRHQPLSVILADINFFKVINDCHGHLVGDAVLREVSRQFQAQLRDNDSVGRYGGEEFLFLLYPCDTEGALTVAERVRQAIADSPIIPGGNSIRPVDVTISLGISSTSIHAGVRADALLKQADDALYRSKANGRNRATMGGANGRSL